MLALGAAVPASARSRSARGTYFDGSDTLFSKRGNLRAGNGTRCTRFRCSAATSRVRMRLHSRMPPLVEQGPAVPAYRESIKMSASLRCLIVPLALPLLMALALPVADTTSVATAADAPAIAAVALPQINVDDTPLDAAELGFDEIVFVKRKPYSSDHYYTDINNGTSPDRFLPENGIYIYNVRTRTERPVVRAADLPGGQGFIGKISLSFDAASCCSIFARTPPPASASGK